MQANSQKLGTFSGVPARAPNLKLVARTQRQLLWLILIMIGVQLWLATAPRTMNAGNTGQTLLIASGIASVIVQLVGIALVVRMASAEGSHWSTCVLYAILMLVPCINVLVLVHVNQRATTMLKDRGVRIGLMGVPRRQMEMLEDGRCRGCGYDMRGLDGARCPECGVEFPLAYG